MVGANHRDFGGAHAPALGEDAVVFAFGRFFDIEGKAVVAAVEVANVGDAEVNAEEVGADCEIGGV